MPFSNRIEHYNLVAWCDLQWAIYASVTSITDEKLVMAILVGQECIRVTNGNIQIYKGIDFRLAVEKFNELVR